jgi:hypothetical protein
VGRALRLKTSPSSRRDKVAWAATVEIGSTYSGAVGFRLRRGLDSGAILLAPYNTVGPARRAGADIDNPALSRTCLAVLCGVKDAPLVLSPSRRYRPQ